MHGQRLGGHFSRRAFVSGVGSLGVSGVGLALLGGCNFLPSPAPHVPRVAFVFPRPIDAKIGTQIEAIRAGLLDYGYADGRNIQIEWRFSASQTGDDLPAIMAELIALPVDLIAASSTIPTQIAQRATSTIPIVGVSVADPVGARLVDNLARPGHNVTAVSSFNIALSGKRVELLRRIVPDLTHVGYIYEPANVSNVVNLNEVRQAAETLGVTVRPIGLRVPDDLEPGVEEAARAGVKALIVTSANIVTAGFRRSAALALRYGLPSIGFERAFPEAGGLMSDGAEPLAIYRRSGYYVDRILKGTRPADLPAELPTLFELVLNSTTTRALGLSLPPEVAAQVSLWIE
jgi:putative ABC transport system substrate-binding protein